MVMISVKSDSYAGLEGNVKKKVFGQDNAISKLVDSILIAKAGLRPVQQADWFILVCWSYRCW